MTEKSMLSDWQYPLTALEAVISAETFLIGVYAPFAAGAPRNPSLEGFRSLAVDMKERLPFATGNEDQREIGGGNEVAYIYRKPVWDIVVMVFNENLSNVYGCCECDKVGEILLTLTNSVASVERSEILNGKYLKTDACEQINQLKLLVVPLCQSLNEYFHWTIRPRGNR